jgi:transposase-like protein
MKGIIYKITNKVNGKSYIGQTRFTLEFRWRQHLHKKDNTYFHNAIRKYGAENFTKEILEECDVDKLNSREIFYIAKYNTFKEGYNLTIGGEGNSTLLLDNKYDEIKSLYLAGFSSNKIAVLYSVDKASIVKILKQLGVKIRRKKITIINQEFLELVRDYQSGYSLKELSKRYDCTSNGLKEYLKNKGVDLKVKYSILKDEDSQMKLIREYTDPYSTLKLSEILNKYHCSFNTFNTILSLHGIKKGRYNLKLKPLECLKVIELINKGVSVQKVAKEFEVDKTTIYTILKRYNVKLPTV